MQRERDAAQTAQTVGVVRRAEQLIVLHTHTHTLVRCVPRDVMTIEPNSHGTTHGTQRSTSSIVDGVHAVTMEIQLLCVVGGVWLVGAVVNIRTNDVDGACLRTRARAIAAYARVSPPPSRRCDSTTVCSDLVMCTVDVV